MIKSRELIDTKSCLSKAADDEILFVLLARDPVAPFAIRAWCGERLRTGKNQPMDAQITEAYACADAMEKYRAVKR